MNLTKYMNSPFLKRFTKNLQFKTDGCILWVGGINGDGYGYFYYKKFLWRVHRLIWTLIKGKIPKNKLVCHTCDIRNCINIKHLFLGTFTDNNRDRANKNRNRNQNGIKNNQAKLTETDIIIIRYLYKNARVYQKTLAKMYKVSSANIGLIVRKERWKHV